jgi:diguanylate cyclase
VLLGLRRFNARHALPGRAWHDGAALAAAMVLCAVAAAFGAPAGGWPGTAATLALHGYAAFVLFRGAEGRDTVPLQSLAAAWALAGLAPLLPAFVAAEGLHAPIVLRALATALAGGITAFVVLMLVCERSERQLRDSRRRLRTLANMDALTQVPNRRHFHELASLALRHDPPASAVLLMFDIDHFKAINDHLGHASGDRVLTLVSGAVLEHLRAHDVAGRQGGDEFVLLLRRADTQAAMGVAARIVAEVQQRAADTRLPHLTLSFGVVQLADGERVEDAIRRADQAMYEAKRQCRSRAVAALGDEAHPVFSESQRLGLTPA